MKRSCPDEEIFCDYLEGRLDDGKAKKIENHIVECERCRQEFIIGKGLVRGIDDSRLDQVPSEVTNAAVELVKGEVSGSSCSLYEKGKHFYEELCHKIKHSYLMHPGLWSRWGIEPVRGAKILVSEDHIKLNRFFKDIRAGIELERVGEKQVNIRVRVQGEDDQTKGTRITLKRLQREIFSSLIDSSGYVLFEDLPFGHYSLVFNRDGLTLGDYSFEIMENRNGKK